MERRVKVGKVTCALLTYHVRELLNAANVNTIVAMRKADSRAQGQNGGRPLSMIAVEGTATIKFELNRNL